MSGDDSETDVDIVNPILCNVQIVSQALFAWCANQTCLERYKTPAFISDGLVIRPYRMPWVHIRRAIIHG